MNVANYLDKDNILFSSKQRDKKNIISFMLDNLVSCNKIDKKNKKDILTTIIQREEMGSTAIGGNIALPHARINSVKNILLSLCIAKEGVDFDSLDEKPVNVIVLLLSNKMQAGTHLKTLAFLARMLRDKFFIQSLKKAKDKEEVLSLLNKQQQAVS
ncbi:MAG: PTS sugar transporter subunit IIA [Candidatus Omnitrophica bacterium]|nr:PTS sugar transporter subunit IIA [Candidatus Omnitrophota bacterium]MCF7878435.1 PTS sugar transporter subunit IIA [Candidatus Omnitrophota bacterium]MCF7892920.1 PTS sugar transporter subunit IIA [Candidatus Omnitrophota bacterium]